MATQMNYHPETVGSTETAPNATHERASEKFTTEKFSTGMLLGILLLLAGWGWDNGQFVQPVQSSWGPLADGLHFIPVMALILLAVGYVRGILAGKSVRGALIGVSIVAVVTTVGCIVMTILGMTNPDPNSVGVHTLEDALPAIVMNLGSLVWFVSLLTRRSRA